MWEAREEEVTEWVTGRTMVTFIQTENKGRGIGPGRKFQTLGNCGDNN